MRSRPLAFALAIAATVFVVFGGAAALLLWRAASRQRNAPTVIVDPKPDVLRPAADIANLLKEGVERIELRGHPTAFTFSGDDAVDLFTGLNIKEAKVEPSREDASGQPCIFLTARDGDEPVEVHCLFAQQMKKDLHWYFELAARRPKFVTVSGRPRRLTPTVWNLENCRLIAEN